MSAWPATRQWLVENGFTLEVRRRCSGKKCGMTIEFWRTPSGRLMPLNLADYRDQSSLRPHWEVCADQREFRGKPTEEKPVKLAKQQTAVKQRKEKVESGRLF